MPRHPEPNLNPRQVKILELLEENERRSIRELQELTSTSTTSVINYHLNRLEEMGYIKRDPRIARGIYLIRNETVGHFELKVDEETGQRYWWGGQDGWKDETEIGEDGTLLISPEHFEIGTVLTFTEPLL